jgi:hydroxymethylglutaryl-CoA lyase
MQGVSTFIPTQKKIDYINTLLKVGFAEVDFSSFVSPRAIPQLADSAEVAEQIDWQNSSSRIMATIGNLRGGQRALEHRAVGSLAYPFSISEAFLAKNIRSDFEKGSQTIRDLITLCREKDKELVLYIAMAFGNPYGDEWNPQILSDWTGRIKEMGVRTIVLADTTGDGHPEDIADSFVHLHCEFPELEFGVHLHTTPDDWHIKLAAAYDSGCRRFDAALGGHGGCPMSGKELIGNLPTEKLIAFLESKGENTGLNMAALAEAQTKAAFTFP